MNDDSKAIAFNEGSDARLQGQDRTANPYVAGHDGLRISWKEGWMDVDKNFGAWSTRRAVYLKPVKDRTIKV